MAASVSADLGFRRPDPDSRSRDVSVPVENRTLPIVIEESDEGQVRLTISPEQAARLFAPATQPSRQSGK